MGIVVPTLGQRPSWLRDNLESLTRQGLPVDILVVSRTPIGTLLDRFVAEVQQEVCETPGLSAALQHGLSRLRNEYVSWLGDDDLLAPGSLKTALAALDRNPSAPFVYGRTRYINEQGDTIGLTRPTSLAARYARYGKDFIPQPGSLLRRSALQTVGDIDVSLRNAMDLDLLLRLQRVGKPVYVPVELSAYRLHPSSITMTKGNLDEGELVRRRHAGTLASRTYRLWRPLSRTIDKWVDRSFRYGPAPKPAPWRPGGRPYTLSSDA
ncbi:glycosyltransferase family 2 protein [Blastococcus saxobsidens]|uniref:Glycosyltransferase family 2 protein n=1 Tax=Blastococcus saxobsidens TaxID=138336 RepID=A0A6L9VXS6_9ACTN|nr:glycosyltransferase family 2 protein [Blastococcus saxobsidens]